jgi:valyl-tRNA synthetase
MQSLYRFFWSEYCDWYVEASKAALANSEPGTRNPNPAAALRANTLAVIDFVLSNTLRLFHPFLPFITEELWHGMGFNRDLPDDQGGRTIMSARWPKPLSDEEKAYFGLEDAADGVAQAKYELVTLGRNLKAQSNLPSNKKFTFILKPAGELAAAEIETLRLLLNAERIDVEPNHTPAKGTPMAANALGELYLPLEGLLDFAAERTRLNKELEKTRIEIGKVREKLANPNFTQKVPPKVLEEHQQRLADWLAKEKQILTALENLPE